MRLMDAFSNVYIEDLGRLVSLHLKLTPRVQVRPHRSFNIIYLKLTPRVQRLE